MPGRVELVLERQLGALGQRRVENGRVGLGEQQPGRLATRVADDLAARRLGRVLGVADSAQRGTVQERPVVEMQQEDRRVRRQCVDLLQRRQPLLRELMLGEAAHDPDPLRRRRACDLRLQHRHRVGEAAHAVPAQLHVEVEPAADDVQVIVDQARQHAPPAEVDLRAVGAGLRQHLPLVTDRREAALGDRDRGHLGQSGIKSREASVEEDSLGWHRMAPGRHGCARASRRRRAARRWS